MTLQWQSMLEASFEHLILNLNVTHIFYWCNNKVTREENFQREVKNHYANGVERTISSFFFKNSFICFFWVYSCMIFFVFVVLHIVGCNL
jgi:hypothetical protein